MDISLAWLNQYLYPGDVSADEADELLTQAGLPIEERTLLDGGDTLLDVEVTSNRTDCLSHVGCAREVAALSGRRLLLPDPEHPTEEGHAASVLTLENRDNADCPLFTARVIRGAAIGPSPDWLVRRLESIGQRAINNAVDATNFVTHELGNPSHVFDLSKLAGPTLVIRRASPGEPLRTLDDKRHALRAEDIVVADAERATSLAGIMGGADSEVDESTTDIVLEVATWDPVTVRTTARRLGITSDAAYRFQRGIDPRTIDLASRRLAALICELTGGTLMGGVLAAGAPFPEPRVVAVRPGRVRTLLGIDAEPERVARVLGGFGLGAEVTASGEIACRIPPHRDRDLLREVDLIEEYARGIGYDEIPASPRIAVAVKPPQPRSLAITEIGRVLTGLGFDETVTFSFTSPAAAGAFLTPGLRTVAVSDDRRKEEPTLRPSALTGLLACRRANQQARSAPPGEVRLFEVAAVFAETAAEAGEPGESVERRTVTALMDVPGSPETGKRSIDEIQLGLRAMRGAIDALVRATLGPEALTEVEPFRDAAPAACWDPAAGGFAAARTPGNAGVELGVFGLVNAKTLARYELETPVVAAELDLDRLVSRFPPKPLAHALPSFPAIERDVSLVVEESVRWKDVEGLAAGLGLERLEALSFVGVYRGKQVGSGKKSVTLRLRFRDPSRTLRREEVEPAVERLIARGREELGAEVRG